MGPTPRLLMQETSSATGSRHQTPRGRHSGVAVANNSWVPPARHGGHAQQISWVPPPAEPSPGAAQVHPRPYSRQGSPNRPSRLVQAQSGQFSYVPQMPSHVPPPQVQTSYVPPVPAQQTSYIPPVQAQQASYVAPPQQQASFVAPPVMTSFVPPPATAQADAGNGDPDVYAPGVEVVIGNHRLRCSHVLGRGSFSEVWSGEEVGTQDRLEVALKDIKCNNQSDLQQAIFEAEMLMGFANGAHGSSPGPPRHRIPRYLAHKVDNRQDAWRVRMAMTRVPGEPLDAFLKRPPPPGQDVQAAVRRGCMLAMQLIRQLAPTLDRISHKAFHRDVNAHNVLLSEAVDGGVYSNSADPEEAISHASFWLIDFGLAVDSSTWNTVWREADIGGDCRYWPQSSWFVSFWGADEMAAQKDLCNQYKTRLDVFGLGITALEVLCTIALDGSNAAGCHPEIGGAADGLRGSWRRLLNAWTKYWTDVTRWHTMIYRVFSLGGDVGPLYQELAKESVVDKVRSRMATIRQCLRACVNRTEDPRIQQLLGVLAEMLDEGSSFGFREAIQALGGNESIPPVVHHTPSYTPPMMTAPAAVAPVAPAMCHVQVPRGFMMVARPGSPTPFQTSEEQSATSPVSAAVAPKLQWCAPSLGTNSFTPLPNSHSYAPPIVPATAPVLAQSAVANTSGQSGNLTITASGTSLWSSKAPPKRDGSQSGKRGPLRSARPQFAGA